MNRRALTAAACCLWCCCAPAAGQLRRRDYLALKCDIKAMLDAEGNAKGPLLVRLAWHCSGTYDKADGSGGCGGARIRFAPERDDPDNAGLKAAMDLLEPFIASHPGVSYADLYTLAGAVAIENMGGRPVPWRWGRADASDGSTSPANGRLPKADGDAAHIRSVFGRMGFDDAETVALIGAHTLGCAHVQNTGYEGCWMDRETVFNNAFFRWLRDRFYVPHIVPATGEEQFVLRRDSTKFMLLADMALLEDMEYERLVDAYANDNRLFVDAFSAAFGKLLELGADLSGEFMRRPLRRLCA